MTAGPKGVAGRPDSLPAQQIAADPLQSYCPDLDQWPASWAHEARDIPHGLRIVECFKPFLREMLARSLSRKTLRLHRDNIWVLGGEVISRVQIDSGLRRRPAEVPVQSAAVPNFRRRGGMSIRESATRWTDPRPWR